VPGPAFAVAVHDDSDIGLTFMSIRGPSFRLLSSAAKERRRKETKHAIPIDDPPGRDNRPDAQ
jgi:hypothetical protein